MDRRFVCSLGVIFITGILTVSEAERFMIPGGIAAVVFMNYNCRKEKLRMIVRSGMLLAFFCLGAFRYETEYLKLTKIQQIEEGTNIRFRGTVKKKEVKGEQFAYYLKNAEIDTEDDTYPAKQIVVYWETDEVPAGAEVFGQGGMTQLRTARNQGAYHERNYQYSIGVSAVLYPEELRVNSVKKYSLPEALYRLRKQIRNVYSRTLSEKDAGIMAAMALGDKSLLEASVKDLYSDSGISHILAISGLHISMIGMGIYRILRKLMFGYFGGALSGGIVVCLFCIMSGAGMSSVRAGLMFLLFLGAEILGRSYDSFCALSVSALFLLWGNPQALWNAGFLFSFLAVLGAAGLGRLFQNNVKHSRKDSRGKFNNASNISNTVKNRLAGIFNTIKTSSCIQLMTLPLNACYYYEIPLYSVPANVLILPFAGVLLAFGIAGGILGAAGIKVSWVLFFPCHGILRFYEGVCLLMQKLPYAVWITGKPGLPGIGIYFLLLAIASAVIVWRQKQKDKKGNIRSKYILAVPGIFLLLLLGLPVPGRFELTFLDVGQGDGIFIGTKEGKNFFIDGGSTSQKNVGNYQILSFLKSKKVRRIDAWFVSHGDEDHISGLLEILDGSYPVKRLVLSEAMPEDEAWKTLTGRAAARNIPVTYMKGGDRISTESLQLTCLDTESASLDRNEKSLVLFLKYKDISALLTGDIGAEQEQQLAKRYRLPKTDILKAAHHGSKGSSCDLFLKDINPGITIISCGEKNRYGHPHKEALMRIRKAKSRILTTAQSGQITFSCQNGVLKAEGFLRK
ncbi:ComEC family competence protein [uncultured Roseburia sp.]|uniref:DNA internalization-related competence protein ComEC/Rec2 n=1 Tax=Brotonthovivens ammoniilytica TaxID=2981725 RepID=A0ABT2TMG0_9FIRM|nr:DNA internalization-related competence protein ComEC/Rec2 [Brotonthovivens ammoniilytica]MCU6763418.1 DNA internalization-related competence protein ComEC/Rec2 [Brotonthovivens ammoniilytica]SCJ18582.1 ComEC family competence protein [uncultured Roseburia sp.]